MERPRDVLVGAGVLVRRPPDGAVLLQLRSDDDTWGLPGGRLASGETLEQAARRELIEETGLMAGRLRLVDIYSGPEFVVRYPGGDAAYVVGATFETSETSGQLRVDDAGETAALSWFDVEQLPSQVNSFNRLLLRRAGLSL